MGIVDAAVAGRAGALPLAAVGLGNGLTLLFSVVGLGVMQGLEPLIAQAVGANNLVAARRLYSQGLLLALAVGVALTVPFLFVPLLLVPLGIEPALAREAGRYFLLRLPGQPAFFAYLAARAYLQARSQARPIFLATLVANVANLGLDVLLVFGGASLPRVLGPLRSVPALGASGTAISTTVCTLLQFALLALFVRGDRVERVPSKFYLDLVALKKALGVGWPIGMHLALEVGIFTLVGFLAARLGEVAVAAHQLAISLASFTFTFALGLGQAGSVRVAWAVGARDQAGSRRCGLAALGSGAIFMAFTALLFLLFPGKLASLMTTDPSVLYAARPLLLVAAAFQVFDGLQAVGAGVLRGLGETRFTLIANFVGHWLVAFPAALIFGFGMGLGVAGLWWGLALGLSTVAILLVARFLRASSRNVVPLLDSCS
jgi:MATE family multidrug resistance protein